MKEVNLELWKMGVTAKTQHNEAAPAQHELAPIYAVANVAVDNNQLVIEVLKKVADRHGLTCLLHEKPFAGVNGSGKHNNWSLTTDDGINLLEPGKTPHENIQFLLVLTCIMRAVDRHAALLRESAADVGNEHRLGAAEAPPAIISIFLGEQLEDVIDQLVSTGSATSSKQGGKLRIGGNLPAVSRDATDRNRTSPFAFTGNKFEFRMVGSADSVASANTVLNAIVAEVFCETADILEQAENVDLAVHDVIKKYASEHQRIIFNGNGYSQEWVEEAERRGLPNLKSMVDAIPALIAEDTVALFEKFNIFTRTELESRAEIQYEAYVKATNIEARAMIDIARKQIIPAVVRYITVLADSYNSVKNTGLELDSSAQEDMLKEVSVLLGDTKRALTELENVSESVKDIEDMETKARAYLEKVMPAMEALRAPVDKLEMLVDKSMWPMPSYGDLIFEV